jgi:hypothetical protein
VEFTNLHSDLAARAPLCSDLACFLTVVLIVLQCTQVEAAQRLGLSGKDTTVCVIDTGIDVSHPTFGACSDGIRGRACRVKFGYDAESDSRDPVSDTAAGACCNTNCGASM